MKRLYKLLLVISLLLAFSLGSLSVNFASDTKVCQKYQINAQNTILVVIDVQKTYIPGRPECWFPEIPGQNTPNKIENVKMLLQMAKRTGMETIVTYELDNTGPRDMPEDVKEALPTQNTEHFVKTFYDITKKEEIAQSLKNGGQKNVIVCGAETDVCVLQSVTGLLQKGYKVFLADDATYTSTTLNSPALKRMDKAGAAIVTTSDIVSAIEKGKKIPKEYGIAGMGTIPDIKAASEAIVIVNFDDESLALLDDPKKEAKIQRIQYLTHIAECMDLPIYFVYDGSIEKTKELLYIPKHLQWVKIKNILDKNLLESIQSLKSKNVEQIVFGGIDEKDQVIRASQIGKLFGFEVHLMEDAYFKEGGTVQQKLDNLYRIGVIPSSVKMVFYDTTGSISPEDVPREWVERVEQKLINGDIPFVEDLPFVIDTQPGSYFKNTKN
ncbi:MAG: cysteine hydrolase [Clostridia bacterium]|nr:cysteine hydrolase [Clostridia bacterium]